MVDGDDERSASSRLNRPRKALGGGGHDQWSCSGFVDHRGLRERRTPGRDWLSVVDYAAVHVGPWLLVVPCPLLLAAVQACNIGPGRGLQRYPCDERVSYVGDPDDEPHDLPSPRFPERGCVEIVTDDGGVASPRAASERDRRGVSARATE